MMKNNEIKFMLKEAANKQEISNLQERILSNVDITKIKEEPKSVALPKRKFNFFPLAMAGVATAALVLTLSITIGVMNNSSNTTNPVNPPVVPSEPAIIGDLEKTKLETFYSIFTINDAPNMINIVNTFNNISYDVVDGRIVDSNKNLKPDMEESIVNDVNPFIQNIEEMLDLTENASSILKANDNQKYDYKNLIEVTNLNYKYYIYYNETLTEEKNTDKSNYKYKADLTGMVVSGNNEYSFTGEKRIKNSKLTYTTNILLSNDEKVSVTEIFAVNDYKIDYSKAFEFRYSYQDGENKKDIEITQNFKNNKTDSVRFIANRGAINEFKMTITTKDNAYINCSIDGRNSEVLSITNNNGEYTYKFKNSNNEYKK